MGAYRGPERTASWTTDAGSNLRLDLPFFFFCLAKFTPSSSLLCCIARQLFRVADHSFCFSRDPTPFVRPDAFFVASCRVPSQSRVSAVLPAHLHALLCRIGPQYLLLLDLFNNLGFGVIRFALSWLCVLPSSGICHSRVVSLGAAALFSVTSDPSARRPAQHC